jgi:hypothetical protein
MYKDSVPYPCNNDAVVGLFLFTAIYNGCRSPFQIYGRRRGSLLAAT